MIWLNWQTQIASGPACSMRSSDDSSLTVSAWCSSRPRSRAASATGGAAILRPRPCGRSGGVTTSTGRCGDTASADPDVHGALDVERHSGKAQAPLLRGLELRRGPFERRVHDRDQWRVVAHPVDQHAVHDADLRRREAEADRVAHEPSHARDLLGERVVELRDLERLALERGVAERPDQRKRGLPALLCFGIERRGLGRRLLGLDLGRRMAVLLLFKHSYRV